jgi:hypothetical protein
MNDEDSLGRLPRKDDLLFAEDKDLYEFGELWGVHERELLYQQGYRRSGRILAEYVAEHGEADVLVFPICHSYRHFVELTLKRLIRIGCRVAHREMTPAEAKLQSEKHDLRRLWSAVKAIVQEVIGDRNISWESEDVQGIEAYIEQLHLVDPGSYSFRYPVTTKGEGTLEDIGQINIGLFSDYMELLCDYLEGCYGFLLHLTDAERDARSLDSADP